jgi:hypothetical protein
MYIPHIRTEDQRIALALFREANASNNDFLAFLFFWQVLDVGGGTPEKIVNQTFLKRREELRIEQWHLDNLPLAGRSLGSYLSDDCRHAIAHIRRWPGKKKLDLDMAEERIRIAHSVRVIKKFAEHHIRHGLQLRDQLVLLRPRSGGFPTFLDRSSSDRRSLVLAYPPWKGPGKRKGNNVVAERTSSHRG